MLTSAEIDLIYSHAYVPEHLPDYVRAISSADAFLMDGYVCYVRGRHLVFVGYPLGQTPVETPVAFEKACKRFRSTTAAVAAPRLWTAVSSFHKDPGDSYYRLDIPVDPIPKRVAYMIHRAERELHVEEERFGKDHERLVEMFLSGRAIAAEHGDIFGNIGNYLAECPSARLLCAKKGKDLVAFDVVDTGSRHYAFYMFNFRSAETYVPGASDLLLTAVTRHAEREGKRWVNLGLGINRGVRRFKEKWGGVPFLPYATTIVRKRSFDLLSLLAGRW